MTKDEARNLAGLWIAAWNAHDLDLIMSHYDDAVELTSPVAAALLGTPEGRVVGKRVCDPIFKKAWKPTRTSTSSLPTCCAA